MIQVSQLAEFDFYKNFRLAAGKKGLGRRISNVIIMEYESVIGDYSGFNEGDFVMTSLFFAKQDESLVKDAMMHLLNLGVSGIAIKTVTFQSISREILDLADEREIPVFYFDTVYMEDIIIAVAEFQKTEDQYSYFEKIIDDLLTFQGKQELIETLLTQNQLSREYFYSALYIGTNTEGHTGRNLRLINKLFYDIRKYQDSMNFISMRYRGGVLLLFYYEEERVDCEPDMSSLLDKLNFYWEDMSVSAADVLTEAGKLDDLLKSCLYTEKIRKKKGIKRLSYSELGIKKYLLPYMGSFVVDAALEQLSVIEEYDRKHESVLFDTLNVYVQNGCLIRPAAEALYQHPNTIRYRISKIAMLLHMEDSREVKNGTGVLKKVLVSRPDYLKPAPINEIAKKWEKTTMDAARMCKGRLYSGEF